MLAKIFNNNKVYITPVLAIQIIKYKCASIILNESYTELTICDLRDLLFIDYDYGNFSIKESNFKSYWNDRDIFNVIRKKKYSLDMINEAKDILNHSNHSEFKAISTSYDIEGLDWNSLSFLESYILGDYIGEDQIEILFKVYDGYFCILKCSGIIENTLKCGEEFCWCDIEITEEKNIKFLFETFTGSESRTLISKQAEYKFIFQKRIHLKSFSYQFLDDELVILDKKKEYRVPLKEINNSILDFKERNIIGYFDSNRCRFSIFFKDYVITFDAMFLYYDLMHFNYYKKKFEAIKNKLNAFREDCKNRGLFFEDTPNIKNN